MHITDFQRLRRILVNRLESLHQAGVMQLPQREAIASRELSDARVEAHPVKSKVPTTDRHTTMSTSQAAASNPVKRDHSVPASGSTRQDHSELFAQADEPRGCGEFGNVPSLQVLQEKVAGCTRCGELAQTRTQTVFGVGNPNARLCFLGEAPGADEDRLGEPFVGRAGQLLTKIIEACHMKRDEVYILNMIKCRPPGNRNPLPTELANCRGFLDRQFELINPEFICCCGAVAAQNLLNTTVSIGKLRGKVHHYRGINVVCIYHPAFLLRSPGFKKQTWEDIKFLMREMGTPLE